MPQVPDRERPTTGFGAWIPDKKEVHNMRHWKAKKAKPKKVYKTNKPAKKKISKQTYEYVYQEQLGRKLRDIV